MHTKLTMLAKTFSDVSFFEVIVVFASIVMSPSVTSVRTPY
jgi:hypothetical protein